ncbi:MAG: hypothetical protein KGL95_14390, partial [Patescibacteria group bacterium]|nr:hypothetical protein [Patescibacteria group bacterium]
MGTGDASSDSEQEVDVTEDIQNLLKYVAKKKEDDPHDGVLSRVHSRLKDIVESLIGESGGGEQHNQPPTTPTITIPDLPQWTFVRKR